MLKSEQVYIVRTSCLGNIAAFRFPEDCLHYVKHAKDAGTFVVFKRGIRMGSVEELSKKSVSFFCDFD